MIAIYIFAVLFISSIIYAAYSMLTGKKDDSGKDDEMTSGDYSGF